MWVVHEKQEINLECDHVRLYMYMKLSFPSIAVIKYYSEHLWNPTATKKKLKPKGRAFYSNVQHTNAQCHAYMYLVPVHVSQSHLYML